MREISVVIPCYNSASFLERTVDKVCNTLEGRDFEIILVNDCSKDKTFDVIQNLVQSKKNILGINLAHNVGQHNATMAGFHYVSGKIILTCADDGQSPLEYWNQMLNELNSGYDVSSVHYINRGKRSVIRRIGSFFSYKFVEWLIERPKGVSIAFEFAAKRFVIDEITKYDAPYASMNGLIFRTTSNIKVLECEQHTRTDGKSGYTIKKLLQLFANQATAFSIKPLRLASVIGVVFALLGFVAGIVTLIRRISGLIGMPGYSSTTIILLLGFGLVMIMLGLIGEYVGRIYMVMNESPQFVVKDVVISNESN